MQKLMPNTNVSRYRVIARIGVGGMGEVFLAEDTELGRRVALKMLPADAAESDESVRRFIQEAKSASALNHPNILTIHEIGQADGVHFIAMEFIEGETLRERLRREPLSVRESVEVAAQVAAALSAAHRAGIIHRDIKPENIMIRRADGIVKVLDFGLAKLIEPSLDEINSEAETRAQVNTTPGTLMGTVLYMSPEQARAQETDARTDVWSLGVTLYEMLAAGRKPFEGETPTDALASILTVEPPPISEFNAETPAELQRIISKTLRKKREERYQNGKELLEDLRALKQELEFRERLGSGIAPHAADVRAAASNSASPDVRADNPCATRRMQTTEAAQVVDTNSKRASREQSASDGFGAKIKRHKVAALGWLSFIVFIVAAALAHFFFARNSNASISSLAVLPFVNASGDKDAEFLSDGITESLINNFTKIPALRVVARSTAFRYKGKDVEPRKIGEELGVSAILTGKILQRGDALNVQVDLIDARDGAEIWGEQYSRKLSDMLSVQQEIAREISERLRWRLTGEERKQIAKNYTANPEAYQLYLRGRYHWNKRTAEDFRKAIDYFKQAIALDPNYALAYSGLSDCYALLPQYDYVPPREYISQAKDAALKSVALDDNLAEAHVSLANVSVSYEYKWADAEREFKRAIELNPNYSTAHQWYAELLSDEGRSDEAIAEIRRALELDPLSLIINTTYGGILADARRYDEGVAQLKKTVGMDANFSAAHCILASVYDAKAMYAEGVAEYAQCNALDGKADYAARMKERFARGGYRTYLRENVEELREASKKIYIPPFVFAEYYSMLGEKDEAFASLEKAFQERDPKMVELKVNSYLNNLRGDARYQDLLHRVGLQ